MTFCTWDKFACMVPQMHEQINDQLKPCVDYRKSDKDRIRPTYSVTDVPPWYLCVFLAIQVSVILLY